MVQDINSLDREFHRQFDEEAQMDVIMKRGSDAIIYGIEYYTIFGDTIRTNRYTKYRKAPTLSLVAFNIETCLKGIIMAISGIELWNEWKAKQKHSLCKLFHSLPDSYMQKGYVKFADAGYEKKSVDSLLEQSAYAYTQFRYYYQNEGDADISKDVEKFLKLFWNIAYDLSLDAQLEYREMNV